MTNSRTVNEPRRGFLCMLCWSNGVLNFTYRFFRITNFFVRNRLYVNYEFCSGMLNMSLGDMYIMHEKHYGNFKAAINLTNCTDIFTKLKP